LKILFVSIWSHAFYLKVLSTHKYSPHISRFGEKMWIKKLKQWMRALSSFLEKKETSEIIFSLNSCLCLESELMLMWWMNLLSEGEERAGSHSARKINRKNFWIIIILNCSWRCCRKKPIKANQNRNTKKNSTAFLWLYSNLRLFLSRRCLLLGNETGTTVQRSPILMIITTIFFVTRNCREQQKESIS
jgi:hypothetical protein